MKRVVMMIFAAALAVGCAVEDDMANDGVDVAEVEHFDSALSTDTDYTYGYKSDYFEFQYFVNSEYGYWGGFAQASSFDMEDGSYTNQYSVYNSSAASGDGYLVYYYDSYNEPCDILCRYAGNYAFTTVKLNLSTYTYKSITEEAVNDFARVFTDGDYLKVTFTALLKDMTEGESVDCYVVDFRDGKRFMATNWDTFDISAMQGELWGLRVTMETSDVGEYGANTPLYVCLDELTYRIEL